MEETKVVKKQKGAKLDQSEQTEAQAMDTN
jgi:hypothetical protein